MQKFLTDHDIGFAPPVLTWNWKPHMGHFNPVSKKRPKICGLVRWWGPFFGVGSVPTLTFSSNISYLILKRWRYCHVEEGYLSHVRGSFYGIVIRCPWCLCNQRVDEGMYIGRWGVVNICSYVEDCIRVVVHFHVVPYGRIWLSVSALDAC